MLNNLEILGQFMYPAGAYRRLLDLLRSGLLDISPIRPRVYPLTALPDAMEAAATAGISNASLCNRSSGELTRI